MSPMDMERPMRIPMDGGLSTGAPPPGPPPPAGGDAVSITQAPGGGFMVSEGGAAPQPIGSLKDLVGFLASRFGNDDAGAPGAGEPPPPPGPPPPPPGA